MGGGAAKVLHAFAPNHMLRKFVSRGVSNLDFTLVNITGSKDPFSLGDDHRNLLAPKALSKFLTWAHWFSTAQNLAIVFLAKTCLDEARLIGIRNKLNFGGYFGVSQVNCGGGLDLFWKHNCAVYVETSSPLML